MTSLDRVLWIGGAQWAGKTSVAQSLAMRYGLIHYSYDYHDSRSHYERGKAEPDRFPHRADLARAIDAGTFAERWVTWTPEQLADDARGNFHDRWQMVLEDVAGLPERGTVVAEGYGLRPEYLERVVDDIRRAVFLIPSPEFRARQIQTLPRAMRIGAPVSDPERAQRNRVARDTILARDVVEVATRLGFRVIEIDGGRSVNDIASDVAGQFAPWLPRWLYDLQTVGGS